MKQVKEGNKLQDYELVVDQLIDTIKADSAINKINLLAFRKANGLVDNIVTTMISDNYFKKSVKKMIFNVLEADRSLFKEWALKQLLNTNEGTLTLMIIDNYKPKNNNFMVRMKTIKNEVLEMNSNLKKINNKRALIYVIGNEDKIKLGLYRLLAKRYDYLTYMETKNERITKGYYYQKLVDLFEIMDVTINNQQIKRILKTDKEKVTKNQATLVIQ